MLLALTLALALNQTYAPILSLGARTEFHEAVTEIEQDLAKSDFDAAKAALSLLPKGDFVMGWDDSGVPAGLRESVTLAREAAIHSWGRIQGFKVKVAPSGDVNVRFVNVLPDGPQGIPLAVRLRFGQNPRLSAEIGLHRGKPAQAIITADVAQAVGRAIGAYLGVADDPIAGNTMYSDDRPALMTGGPSVPQLFTASGNLKAAVQLQSLVENKQSIPLSVPSLSLTPSRGDMGTILQGTHVPLEFKLTNSGTSPLMYSLVPDCGCFSHVPPGVVQPGKTITLRTLVNTQEYIGPIKKLLVLYTNDPKNSEVQIPVSFKARPAFRLFRPEGDKVVVPDGGTAVDVYLFLPKDSPIEPERFEWDGIDGKVSMEKWRGQLADPEMDEPAMPRDGYKFHIKISGKLIPGRSPGTLLIETGDTTFGELRYTISAQKGVISLPDAIVLGEIVGVTRASIEVSRPGQPFHILSVTTGSSALKAVVTTDGFKDRYRIDVACDGNAPKGDFSSWIRLKLDDPKQTTLMIPVSGQID